MKWVLVLSIFLSFDSASAGFLALEAKLTDESFLVKTCLEVSTKNKKQIQYNQKVVDKLINKKSVDEEESESLEAAKMELDRLSQEATHVTIIAGSIDDSTTLSIDLNCDKAVLESNVTDFTDSMFSGPSEIRRIKFSAPSNESTELIIETVGRGTDKIYVSHDGKIFIKNWPESDNTELKHLYMLPFPNGLNELFYSLQRVTGI